MTSFGVNTEGYHRAASLKPYRYPLWAERLTLTLLHHKGAEFLLVHE
jgi:hypothetical protein